MFLLRLYNVKMTIENISTIFNSIYKKRLFKISKFYRMKFMLHQCSLSPSQVPYLYSLKTSEKQQVRNSTFPGDIYLLKVRKLKP